MEMSLKVTDSITINASPAEVWNALTDKEMIKKYFWGTEAKSDWKEDSKISFSGTWDGTNYEDKGTILKIEKESILKHDYWSSFWGEETGKDERSIITYELTKKSDNQTELSVTQQGFRDDQARDHSAGSWKEILKNIKGLLEKSKQGTQKVS